MRHFILSHSVVFQQIFYQIIFPFLTSDNNAYSVGEHSSQTQTGGGHQIQIEIAVSASGETAQKDVYATYFFTQYVIYYNYN